MLDSAFAHDNFDELALFPYNDRRLAGITLDGSLVALEFRAELGERQDADLDADGLDLLANFAAVLLAHLFLHCTELLNTDSFVDEFRFAECLPHILGVNVNFDTLAHSDFLRYLFAHLERDLLGHEEAAWFTHVSTLDK